MKNLSATKTLTNAETLDSLLDKISKDIKLLQALETKRLDANTTFTSKDNADLNSITASVQKMRLEIKDKYASIQGEITGIMDAADAKIKVYTKERTDKADAIRRLTDSFKTKYDEFIQLLSRLADPNEDVRNRATEELKRLVERAKQEEEAESASTATPTPKPNPAASAATPPPASPPPAPKSPASPPPVPPPPASPPPAPKSPASPPPASPPPAPKSPAPKSPAPQPAASVTPKPPQPAASVTPKPPQPAAGVTPPPKPNPAASVTPKPPQPAASAATPHIWDGVTPLGPLSGRRGTPIEQRHAGKLQAGMLVFRGPGWNNKGDEDTLRGGLGRIARIDTVNNTIEVSWIKEPNKTFTYKLGTNPSNSEIESINIKDEQYFVDIWNAAAKQNPVKNEL